MTTTLPLIVGEHSTGSVQQEVKINRIITAYCGLNALQFRDIAGPSKTSTITFYRHELMYLIRRLDPTASFTLIGRAIGGRDMATVHVAVAKVDLRLRRDADYALRIGALVRQIDGPEQADTLRYPTQAKAWQISAARLVLADDQLTDAEARKVALGFLKQLEAAHG